MATILNPDQAGRRSAAQSTGLKAKPRPQSFEKESDLCALFIQQFNELEGWRCYPEAAGFDVLVVHEDGRQIGVQAKLILNAKVADQILPNAGDDFFGRPGPDYRLVVVGRITDASAGIAKMLARNGVSVIHPRTQGAGYTFDSFYSILEANNHDPMYGNQYLFDWNPAERCRVPALATGLPAGVPAPVQLTPWKEAALKVIALLRRQGSVTAKQIAAFGIASNSWTHPAGDKSAWLAKGQVSGQWVETEHLPAFDQQHPEMYELAVKSIDAEHRNLSLF